eukprot:gene9557-biopygen13190
MVAHLAAALRGEDTREGHERVVARRVVWGRRVGAHAIGEGPQFLELREERILTGRRKARRPALRPDAAVARRGAAVRGAVRPPAGVPRRLRAPPSRIRRRRSRRGPPSCIRRRRSAPARRLRRPPHPAEDPSKGPPGQLCGQ